MNLQQHLEDLRTIRSQVSLLIVEIEIELRRQNAMAPVKAFEEHWKSMGKPVALSQADGYVDEPTSGTVGEWRAYVDHCLAAKKEGVIFGYTAWQNAGRPRG